MDKTTMESIWSAVRTIGAAVIGYMAGAKIIPPDAMPYVNQIGGAIVLLVPLLWGIWEKQQAEKVTQEREAKALNIGIAVADATPGVTPAIAPENVQKIIAVIPPAVAAPVAAPDILATVKAVTAPAVPSTEGETK